MFDPVHLPMSYRCEQAGKRGFVAGMACTRVIRGGMFCGALRNCRGKCRKQHRPPVISDSENEEKKPCPMHKTRAPRQLAITGYYSTQKNNGTRTRVEDAPAVGATGPRHTASCTARRRIAPGPSSSPGRSSLPASHPSSSPYSPRP